MDGYSSPYCTVYTINNPGEFYTIQNHRLHSSSSNSLSLPTSPSPHLETVISGLYHHVCYIHLSDIWLYSTPLSSRLPQYQPHLPSDTSSSPRSSTLQLLPSFLLSSSPRIVVDQTSCADNFPCLVGLSEEASLCQKLFYLGTPTSRLQVFEESSRLVLSSSPNVPIIPTRFPAAIDSFVASSLYPLPIHLSTRS